MKHSIIGLTALAAIATTAIAIPLAAADPAKLAETLEAPVAPDVPVALLVDLSSGQTLFAREPDRRFVPASVTKVMTAYAAFKLIAEGKLSPDTPLIVSKEIEELWSGEGSSMFLKAGEQVTVGQLLLGVTTVSANDGAVMLGINAAGSLDKWLALMNANAAELGMRNTHFGTPNGYPDEGRTYTSARDLAILAGAMTSRYPGLYRRYVGHHGMSYRNITQANHDPITGTVEGADGIKTGYTKQSGYNFLGSAERKQRRLVVVVAGAPTVAARNRSARELMEWGFAAFDSRPLLPAETTVGYAAVQGGADMSVALQTANYVAASVRRGARMDEPKMEVRYRGPLQAPIAKGQRLGALRITLPGREPHDVPLIAAAAVPKADLIDRLRNGLYSLVS